MDGAFTASFDEVGAMALAFVWLGAFGSLAALTFRSVTVS
jgi:hypothetical protein